MSSSDSSSSSKNKRGASGMDGDDEPKDNTKRQRCTMDEVDGPQQQRRQKERVAELERQEKAIEEEIAEDDRMIAQLECAREAKRRRREATVAELERLKRAEQFAIHRGQVRRSTAHARIQECLGMIKSGSVPLDELLEQQFPSLIDDVDFWFAFLYEEYNIPLTVKTKVCQVLNRRKPPTVLNDKKLVLQLCAYDPFTYVIIPEDWQLKRDRQIIGSVLEISPFLVAAIPGPSQLQNLSLVGKILARIPLWCEQFQNYVQSGVDTRAWHNRDVVLGWVKGGGGLHTIPIPETFHDDQEIVLTALGNKKATGLQTLIASHRLRADMEFLKQAVEKNPRALNRVAENLIGDKDLAVTALSGANGVLAVRLVQQRFVSASEGEEDDSNHLFWSKIGESMRKDLRAHNAFVKLILGSIYFSDSKPSALAVLDQGTETSLVTKKLIAEYAGIPIGKDLAKLLHARRNLGNAGVPCSR